MSTYTWPSTAAHPWWLLRQNLRTYHNNRSSISPLSGYTQTLALPGARWGWALDFPSHTYAERSQLEGFFARLNGNEHRLQLWDMTRPAPLGTARGSISLRAAAAQFATSIDLTGLRAGQNLLRRANAYATLDSGWTLLNSTLAYNNAVGPTGLTNAHTLTRTATGNHYALWELTTTSHSSRTVTFRVWLKRGTLTGDVVLRIWDGTGAYTSGVTVTPGTGWSEHVVHTVMPASPAANVKVFIDPVDDAGAAGETLFFGGATLELGQASCGLCRLEPDTAVGPAGLQDAYTMVRTATGNSFFGVAATRTIAAGEVFTVSGWFKAGTETGNVYLQLYDATNLTILGTATITPTGSWQRYSVSGTFVAGSSQVQLLVNPLNDAGTAGATLLLYGLQLEVGSVATTHYPKATLLQGDWLGLSGQLLMVAADAQADPAGNAVVEVRHMLRAAASSAAAVTWDKPAALFIMAEPAMEWPRGAGNLTPEASVELVEVFA